MKFNKNKLKSYGINGLKNKDLVSVLKTKAEYLKSHNKNYTKSQYYEIMDIYEIIDSLEA